MPEWSLVTRAHVLSAIAECDRLGPREFLSRYRFGRSAASSLWHDGQEYDSRAVLGCAYLRATGRIPTRADFQHDERGAVNVLKTLGFDVVVDIEALEQSQPVESPSPDEQPSGRPAKRAAAAPKKPPRAERTQPPVRLCPKCHVAVPASGVCDFCD